MARRRSARATSARATARSKPRRAAARPRPARATRAAASAARPKRAAAPAARPKRAAAPAARPKRATAPAARPKRPARAAAPVSLAPNGKPTPSAVGLTHLQMQFATQDLAAVRRFYVETLGFSNAIAPEGSPFFTVFLTPTTSLWFMTPGDDLPPEHWQPPGEPFFYVFVEDVDRAHADLEAKGVPFEQEPRDMPWGHRAAMLRDPEGRRIILATNPKPARG